MDARCANVYISPLSLFRSQPRLRDPRRSSLHTHAVRGGRQEWGNGKWEMGGREWGSRAASRNWGGPCMSRVCISMRPGRSPRFVSNVTQFACCLISVMLYTYTYTRMPEANVCYQPITQGRGRRGSESEPVAGSGLVLWIDATVGHVKSCSNPIQSYGIRKYTDCYY